MNDWLVGAMSVAAAVAIFAFGWVVSANTIAAECKHVGTFYVGNTVFECKVR